MKPDTITPMSEEQASRRRPRSILIALGLVLLVFAVYLLTVFRFGAEIMNRAM